MNRRLISTAIGLALTSGYAVANNAITDNTNDDYVVAGDYIQIAVPATGLLAAWLYDDAEGAKQLTYSLATTVGIVQAGKFAVGRIRPNASNTASFPSGHTAAAFSGAAFLQTRYGAKWGIPGYAAATFVGMSRIHGNRHYADDVLAGAGIAFLTNQFFVSEYTPEGVSFGAAPMKDGMMLNVSVTNEALDYESDRQRNNPTYPSKKRHSFTLDIGFNTYDTMADLGANQTIKNSAPLDPYQPYATALYEYKIDDSTSLEVLLSPNETRRSGKVTEGFQLDNVTYTAGEEVFLALRQWSTGASYIKHFELNDQLTLSAGAGLYAYLIELEADRSNGGAHAALTSYPVLPSFTGKLDYQFHQDWSLRGKFDFQALSDDRAFASEAGVNYTINPEWDVAMKYAYTDNRWGKSKVRFKSESVVLSVTNHF
ncbi:phosphatase PAP2 family protein [Vibrio sinaloensis]|uniref:phosphatase PAP2 family protein n=1 Tax=Photobacterium sp. (strain ATCC 43367) TaxID=379097 RepID=UPI0020684B7F|nr:phosphatase PAP2 family protein [Vibrio sinaloensis]UPQ89520.1 phosphatase PAP2 family protein [Vibrio sinaloensis]